MSTSRSIKVRCRPFDPARTVGAVALRSGVVAPVPSLRLFSHVDPYPLLLGRPFEREWERDAHLRLVRLVALAQEAVLRHRESDIGLYACPDDELGDRLDGLLARLDPVALGLPPFAIVRRVPAGGVSDRGFEPDPARALALLSRVSGSVFVRRRAPATAVMRIPRMAFAFYAAPGAGEVPA
jgi:hypothetical protein